MGLIKYGGLLNLIYFVLEIFPSVSCFAVSGTV